MKVSAGLVLLRALRKTPFHASPILSGGFPSILKFLDFKQITLISALIGMLFSLCAYLTSNFPLFGRESSYWIGAHPNNLILTRLLQ